MNKIIETFLPKSFARYIGYESDGERMDRLVTEALMSGPSKEYSEKDLDNLQDGLLAELDIINAG